MGEDQPMVPRSGVDAPLPGTFEEDGIDPLLIPAQRADPVAGHYASLAVRKARC